ncbi:MAG: LysM peptidoglycan-binding domain-containing protein [Candidatus Dormibacteraeota bacterium]|nr:LysM peptidoglycan-binding domain-containing protein [Candidatus Dormibacteraeota bacterium]
MAVISRFFAHVIVLVVAISLAGYATVNQDFRSSANLRLGVVNAQGLALGEGGQSGSVELGRSGTIVKPAGLPNGPQLQHQPIRYTAKDGDDIYSVAKRFQVSSNEVRWSNPTVLAKSDRIVGGEQLIVPPLHGVVVTVKAGDTLTDLAARYHASAQTIADFNYLRSGDQLPAGDQLIVPGGIGPQLWPRRFSDEAPHMGTFSNSKFVYGQCTWYAASRRYVPWTGDAHAWYDNARALGYPVGQTPQPGAFMITWESVYYGHVAFVEQVNEDGSFQISEMNYKGWNEIDTRLLSPADYSKVHLIGFIY